MEPSTVPAATAEPRAPTTTLSPNEISELVARLAKLDSGAVSDALDRLGLGGVLTGLVVAPGDLVLADGSGVAVVPFEHAAQIVAAAEDIAAKEAAMASARRGGARPSQVMGASYEELLHPC